MNRYLLRLLAGASCGAVFMAALASASSSPGATRPQIGSTQAAATGGLRVGQEPRDRLHRRHLDRRLVRVLRAAAFTGQVGQSLERRLGRELDPELADIGRLLFFDKILSLRNDNSCAGCHSPADGFGDSQPIAIGISSNDVVGPNRSGMRNQRRSPSIANTAFYPALMWTPRFVAVSGDPFDASRGFQFPAPENLVTDAPTLLAAQGSLPSTELVEMGGFCGIADNPGPFDARFFQFDDGEGQELPAPDESGFHNFPIQTLIDARLNANPVYLARFGEVFNRGRPLPPGGITMHMRRLALAEFQMAMIAANAPLDRFARGQRQAMTREQKRGALLFFGKAGCVACHRVAGKSNEMFSDFRAHRIAGPQLAPVFGVGTGNVVFNGPGEDEDFGFEQNTGRRADRYAFRTAPLRNLKVSPSYFHNGAFATLEAAIRHHLDVPRSLRSYDPAVNRVPADLRPGPYRGMLAAGVDPLLSRHSRLSEREIDDLVEFVRDGLFDDSVLEFCRFVPHAVPSGMPLQDFEDCD